MTDTKFTPGPWRVSYERGTTQIRVSDGESIMCDETYYPWVPENMADWDLIAAAPELYAAAEEPERRLRECAKNIRDEYPLWAHDLEEMADRLAEALAKARGEG